MKPLDPRLLRHARASRRYILLTAGLGLATAGVVIAQAWLLGNITAPVVTGESVLEDVLPLIGWLTLALAARAVLVATQERFAHRAATRVIAELRHGVLRQAVDLGPRWLAEDRRTAIVTLATRGLDALEPYFVRYLPQLLLAATVTPAVLIVVFGLDTVAGITIAVTIPLIPLFMVLVGQLTQRYAADRMRALQRLGSQLLDLLAGLSTLKALGRERGPAARVQALGTAYRRTTMQTLRVAFLSGAVLELLATLSVALVAVGVGLRLVYGQLDLTTGLIVLILAPEVYLPLRQVGVHFHASADGVAAAQDAFAILDEPLPAQGSTQAPDLRTTEVSWRDVSVRSPGREQWAPDGLTATVAPGKVLALAGPSGAGKTTAAMVLLGLVAPDRGAVSFAADPGRTQDLADMDLTTWWPQVTWVPQRPLLLPGTVRENVLGPAQPGIGPAHPGIDADDEALAEAAATTGLDGVVASLPHGWETTIGHGGAGLSLGQRQRLALTRALLGSEPLVVLDEPTAHLDAASEAQVTGTIRAIADAGRTVVVIAHRQAVLTAADAVVTVRSAPLEAPGAAPAAAGPDSGSPDAEAGA